MGYTITCEELAKRIGLGAVVVDVMTPEDYARCHVAGAKNACIYEMIFLERIAGCAPAPVADLVVYDATGSTKTAALARERLLQAGYTNVSVLSGGLLAWQRAGLPVEACDQPSLPQATLADGVYRVDNEKSVLEWIGRNLNYRHHGRIGLREGELVFTDGRLSKAYLVLDMRTLSNLDLQDPELRDMLTRHLKSEDFFAVERFETASLRLTGWQQQDGLPPEAPGGIATCDLTIKGVTRPVDVPVTVAPQLDGSIKVHAALDIDRTLWNVSYGSGKLYERLGMHFVHDMISLELFLTADSA
jgi:polyisoprenoid-binding protein YceI